MNGLDSVSSGSERNLVLNDKQTQKELANNAMRSANSPETNVVALYPEQEVEVSMAA